MPYVVCEGPLNWETFRRRMYCHSNLKTRRRPSSSALGILNKIYLRTLRASGLDTDISSSDISVSDGTSIILDDVGLSVIGGMPEPVRVEPQVGRKDGKKEE